VSFSPIDISESLSSLRDGANVLAIHGLNRSTGSSDFLINAELHIGQSYPIRLDPDLQAFTSPLNLTDSIDIKARTLRSNAWSTLTHGAYTQAAVRESLRVSELMYHPFDSGAPNDPNLEYIELLNTGDGPINPALVRFTDGVQFQFPSMILGAGERVLVVRDWSAFAAHYDSDLPVVGQYDGRLDNGGEWIEIRDAAHTIIQRFRYHDDWHPQTDGEGYALVAINPHHPDPNVLSQAEHWHAGSAFGGTPGR
jgi:hypothetical protein